MGKASWETRFAARISCTDCCLEFCPSDMNTAFLRISFTAVILLGIICPTARAVTPAAPGTTRLKDIISIEGVRENQLVGYGVVVGLAGTGDKRQTVFSAQSLANMLERMGITVSPTAIRVANTAAVMLTATLPAFAQPGTRI